jgi:glycosyltransferase involved in cell wall biosynthesis
MLDPRGEATPYDKFFVPHIDFKLSDLGFSQRASMAAAAIYSRDARQRIRQMIRQFRPAVAHVRNIYHHLSPSILWELKAQGVPVIYHINDFKMLCPNRNFVAGKQVCEQCAGGSFWRVTTQNCHSGSRGSTLVLAAEAYLHRWLRTYERCVSIIVSPSEFAKAKLIENGWSERDIKVLPHFQRLPAFPAPRTTPDSPVLYFGRLSAEKGVDDLLRAMELLPQIHLEIAGEGMQRQALEQLSAELQLKNVRFTGHQSGRDLELLIARAQFTVFPSRAYEILGKSILESYAWGRAVVASDLGSRREIVHPGRTGLLFPPGNIEKMAEAISFLAEHPAQATAMGDAGRELLLEHHSPEKYSLALNQLYEQLSVKASIRTAPTKPTPARTKLRVAFIGGRGVLSKYAGIETYYEEVGKRLAAHGHDVTVYCRTYFTPQLERHSGMNLVRLPTIRSKHLDTFIHTLLSTVHVMFSRCDVVHYHALGPAIFSFLPRLVGKKTVVTVQGLDWRRKKWSRAAASLLRLGEKAAVKFPNSTMVVSRTLQNYFSMRYRTSPAYVPNGTSLRDRGDTSHLRALGLLPGQYLLFLGRFSPEKNCDMLIDVFEKINPSVKLVLAGGSSHTNAYERRLRARQTDKIRLLDWVSGETLDELIANAMLFVLPSDLEGLSVALLEAMGAGVCALTSDIPENCEVVEGAGFTFKRGEVNDLERMLRLLISDSRVRRAAARRGQERMRERYLWEMVARDVDQIYQQVMSPSSEAGPIELSRDADPRAA